ncbi:MAG: hypothetical protein VX496_05550 [Planctomycetota bacterium]|nr:hypothetical protein [Planctomycetota bacterium]
MKTPKIFNYNNLRWTFQLCKALGVVFCLILALSACKPGDSTAKGPASPVEPAAAEETKNAPGIDKTDQKPAPVDPRAAEAALKKAAEIPEKGQEASCSSLLLKISAVFNEIPGNPGRMQPKKADAFTRKVEEGVQNCEKFLKDCPGHSAAAEVHFYQARFLQLLSSRVRAQLIKDMSAGGNKFSLEQLENRIAPFYARIVSHSDSAVAGLKDDSNFKPEAIELRAWGKNILKLAKPAREDYLLWLKKYPGNPRSTMITASLGRVLSTLEEYEKGIALVEKKMGDPEAGQSEDFPVLVETRWKLYEAKGDPEGLLRSAENSLQDYRLRLTSKKSPAELKKTYSRYIAFNGFRKGYALMALGRFNEAAGAFNLHIDEINKWQKELQEKGGALEPAISIYQKRSINALDFLDNRAQRPAPTDFNLGEMWVTPRRTRLADSQGKVVAILFRGADDVRSATFMQNVDQFTRENDGIELVSIHFFKGAKNVDEQLDGLRLELSNVGYQGAAGFDPDMKPPRKIFDAWNVYVGSASFLIVDKRGHPVWFQQDPRTRDSNLARNLLLRTRDAQ